MAACYLSCDRKKGGRNPGTERREKFWQRLKWSEPWPKDEVANLHTSMFNLETALKCRARPAGYHPDPMSKSKNCRRLFKQHNYCCNSQSACAGKAMKRAAIFLGPLASVRRALSRSDTDLKNLTRDVRQALKNMLNATRQQCKERASGRFQREKCRYNRTSKNDTDWQECFSFLQDFAANRQQAYSTEDILMLMLERLNYTLVPEERWKWTRDWSREQLGLLRNLKRRLGNDSYFRSKLNSDTGLDEPSSCKKMFQPPDYNCHSHSDCKYRVIRRLVMFRYTLRKMARVLREALTDKQYKHSARINMRKATAALEDFLINVSSIESGRSSPDCNSFKGKTTEATTDTRPKPAMDESSRTARRCASSLRQQVDLLHGNQDDTNNAHAQVVLLLYGHLLNYLREIDLRHEEKFYKKMRKTTEAAFANRKARKFANTTQHEIGDAVEALARKFK